jgi:hypothetical protein
MHFSTLTNVRQICYAFNFFCVNFFCPGSAFPILIWIQIQDSQINADPDLDLSPQHCLLGIILKSMVL